jgi:hypothetical protein
MTVTLLQLLQSFFELGVGMLHVLHARVSGRSFFSFTQFGGATFAIVLPLAVEIANHFNRCSAMAWMALFLSGRGARTV